MKILLTGATGSIGKKLKLDLSKNHEVFEICKRNLKNSKKNNIYLLNLEKLNDNFKNKLSNLKKEKIDCIIHLAFKVNKNKSSNNFNLLNQNNNITFSLVEIIKYLKPKIFLNFSSTSVYSNTSGKYHENSNMNPSGNSDFFYGLSKINSEYIFNNLLSNLNLRIIHLRIAQVLSNDMPKNRIYSIFQRQIKKFNRIEIFGDGKRKIPIIFLDDLIIKINKLLTSKISGPINLCSENITIHNLAKKIILKNGNKKSKIIFLNDKVSYNKNFNIDFTLAKKL